MVRTVRTNFAVDGEWIIMPMRRQLSLFALLLLILGCAQESRQLIIKSINVPTTVKVNETEYVILDCDYDFENTSKVGLVVKWYFNNNELVYQWIHDSIPKAGETIIKYIDLTYKASDDPYTEYRAMKLNNPGIDLTGDYTCVIFTFTDEQIANSSMTVYSTEEKFIFDHRKKTIDDKDGVEVTCKAEGLFPQPIINITISDVPGKQAEKPTVTLRADGLYDILSRVTLLDEDLPEPAILKCLLDIPKANYSVSRKIVYYSGTTTTTSTVTTIPQHNMDIQAINSSKPDNDGGNFIGRDINFLLLPMQLVIYIVFR